MKQSISIFLFFWICGVAYPQNPKVNILPHIIYTILYKPDYQKESPHITNSG